MGKTGQHSEKTSPHHRATSRQDHHRFYYAHARINHYLFSSAGGKYAIYTHTVAHKHKIVYLLMSCEKQQH